MAFRFSLEPVLQLRRSQQRQQELILQKASEQTNRVSIELQMIDEEIQQVSSISKSKLEISGSEMQFDEHRCDILGRRRLQTLLRLNEARERQLLAATEFQRAWQKREALESLCRRERETYALEETRREQRAQDELFQQRKRSFLPGALGKGYPLS